ncbi:hypothetical protein B7P43_G16621 [Cryptotermes secundus]|uniref:GPI ethanolamine phosphate transferase 1 n=1 Tax=Cryptotermes secundus TaxID=105785 RepID=A0A2J7RKI4_9NEOP|nr:hypothetical protein B7P43_G16621 [Cryptotermes secundus]
MRNACRILVGKPEGNRPLGRLRRMWVDNIKMDLREIGWDGMDWIDLAQDRDLWRALVNMGWKDNPVESDSVFDECRYTWSWGSPDILPIFAKGASGSHVYIDVYGSEVEDFSGRRSTTRLDTWVFRKVEEFLNRAKTDAVLNEKLHQDKIVFFPHLLGLDTAGHTHKPHSVDVSQADVAPLMASLIGIPVPVSSVIVASEELIALSLLGLNYYQNYYQRLLLTCVTLAFLGWIAWLLHSLVGDDSSHKKSPSFLHVQHDEVYQEHELLTFTHSRLFRGDCCVNIAFLFLVILTMSLICIQMLLLQFYIYFLLAELIWWAVAQHWATLMAAISHVRSSMGLRRLLMFFVFHVIAIEILEYWLWDPLDILSSAYWELFPRSVIKMCVVSFFYRSFLSIGMLGIAVWPIVFLLAQPVHLPLLAGWLTSCLFLALFLLLPVVGREPNTQLVVPLIFCNFHHSCQMNILFIASGVGLSPLYCSHFLPIVPTPDDRYMKMIIIHSASRMFTSYFSKPYHSCYDNEEFYPSILFHISLKSDNMHSIQILSYLCLVHMIIFTLEIQLCSTCGVTGLYVLCKSDDYQAANPKKLQITTSTFPARSCNSFVSNKTSFVLQLLRVCQLFYIVVSLFRSGNIASINSFDPNWVRCFVTVFSPFIMTLLILWKIMIPFLAVTCIYRALNIIVQVKGSKPHWRTSIAPFTSLPVMRMWVNIMFCLLQAPTGKLFFTTLLFLVLLYGLACVLTSISLWPLLEADGHCHLLRYKYEKSRVSLELGQPQNKNSVTHVTEQKQHTE